MFPYMIIETIDTNFQNGVTFLLQNGYHNMDCTHSPVILDFSSENKHIQS